MALNRLRQGDIKVGAPLPWDAFDSAGRLLLRQGAVVQSQDQLERLIEVGLFKNAANAHAASSGTDTVKQTGLAHEESAKDRVFVFDLLDELRAELRALLLPRPVEHEFPERLLVLAGRIQHVCDIDADVALASVLLSRTMPYSTRHACNAAVITEMLCRQLEWPPERRISGVTAALTMNISMLELQDTLYHQQSALDPAQKAAIHAHPAAAVAALQQLGVSDSDWLSTVAQHHEALDGSGYPARLQGDAVTTQARIATIADKYCAIISERGYREGVPADVALRQLLVAQGSALDAQLAARLVREVGIFPPGTPVELNNGEIGIVVKRTLDPRHPVVRAVLNSQGVALREFPKRLTSKPAFAVKSAIARSRLGPQFDPTPLWYPTMVAREAPNSPD